MTATKLQAKGRGTKLLVGPQGHYFFLLRFLFVLELDAGLFFALYVLYVRNWM